MQNTASGQITLYSNTTGSNNTALGFQAGMNITGSNNIAIANVGNAADNGVIRIGTKGTHRAAVIAGISTSTVSGAAVLVTTTGRLGVASSSRRYKEDIHPIGDLSERLFNLQPVSFRYKKADEEGNKPVQFGLIAEDVAKAFPELVIANDKGQPETVAYHVLPTLLLNELQKEHQARQRDHKDLQEARALIKVQAEQLIETRLLLKRLSARLDSTLVAQTDGGQ